MFKVEKEKKNISVQLFNNFGQINKPNHPFWTNVIFYKFLIQNLISFF